MHPAMVLYWDKEWSEEWNIRGLHSHICGNLKWENLRHWVWAPARRHSSGVLSGALLLQMPGIHIVVLRCSLLEHHGGSMRVMATSSSLHRSQGVSEISLHVGIVALLASVVPVYKMACIPCQSGVGLGCL